MNERSFTASIPCDDHAEVLRFERIVWGKNDECLEFSVMDPYIGRNPYQGLLGRFRRAWHAFFAKPICYAGIIVTDPQRAKLFLQECLAILETEVGGGDYGKAYPSGEAK